MEIKIKNLEHIREAARQFIAEMGDRKVFAFYGKIGRASCRERVFLTV